MNDLILAGGGTILLGLLGGIIAKWRGKILGLLNALNEFLDVMFVILKAVEDKKLTTHEIKKIKTEMYEFKLAVEKLLGRT